MNVGSKRDRRTDGTARLLCALVTLLSISVGGCRSGLYTYANVVDTDGGTPDLPPLPDGAVPDIAPPGDDSLPPMADLPPFAPDLAVLPAECPEAAVAPSLFQLRKLVTGTWDGTDTNAFEPPASVELVLRGDDTYSAHALAGTQPVFYYGDNVDTARQTYLIDNIIANGDGSGEINISWNNGSSITRGALEHIRVCQIGGVDHLSFEFFATWLNRVGPFTYMLARVK